MFSLKKAAFLALGYTAIANAQFVAITGVHDGVGSDGSRPLRLNIDTLQNDPYAWPLYVQALAAMQNTSPKQATSYFEVAGIHGRPYTAWDNVNGPNTYTGYCTHDSVLFPTWHRPYVALFELAYNVKQQLNANAQGIASQYNGPDKANYQAAARTLRMPYWDWAASPAMPNVMSERTLVINTPGGQQQINNPLYTYKFPSLNPTYFPRSGESDSYLAADANTIRDPNANAVLAAAGLTLSTYNLFSRISDYSTFATQAVSGSSLEAVHGTVHVSVGGETGHMSQLSYAAFDPIFWLHHTNVDRIFALWQATHPQTFLPTGGLIDQYGTFTIAPNTYEFSNTVLTPFSSSTSGIMYTSDSARSMATFGYSYPEIIDWNQTSAQLASSATAQVNALYNRSVAHRRRHTRDLSNGTAKEWFANISVEKFDVDASYRVLLFLGAPPADVTTYSSASNLAGSLFVYIPPTNTTMTGTMKTHAEVPLQNALEIAGLPDLSEATVSTYLTKNLQWRVQKTDGTVVDLAQVPSLQILVQDEEVTLPSDVHSFPTYGQVTPHPEITEGKVGGS